MITRKLIDHPYAQATVICDDNGNKRLISYTTEVAGIKDNKAYCNGLYSNTTRRHISEFARENGLTYQFFKMLYEQGVEMDLETGEVFERG